MNQKKIKDCLIRSKTFYDKFETFEVGWDLLRLVKNQRRGIVKMIQILILNFYALQLLHYFSTYLLLQ